MLASGPRFVDRALERGLDLVVTFGSEEKNYIIERTGTGAGLSDYDGDGDLDVYLVNGSLLDLPDGAEKPSDRLYRNDGTARFTDVTEAAGLRESEWGAGCLFADFDDDGDPDLFVSNFGPDVLYRNNGDGTFENVSIAARGPRPALGLGSGRRRFRLRRLPRPGRREPRGLRPERAPGPGLLLERSEGLLRAPLPPSRDASSL